MISAKVAASHHSSARTERTSVARHHEFMVLERRGRRLIVRDGLVAQRFVYRDGCGFQGFRIDPETLDLALGLEHGEDVVLVVTERLVIADKRPLSHQLLLVN